MENGVTNNTSIQSIICQPACSLGQLQTIKDDNNDFVPADEMIQELIRDN
jgi:hypothetical protein